MARIGKTFTFEASHQLPNHLGKCRRLHGHSYVVELVLDGPIQPADETPSEGMVVDFGKVSDAWVPLHRRLDHHHLNDVVPASWHPTTAENLAAFILAELTPALPALVSVRVWETAKAWAEATLR